MRGCPMILNNQTFIHCDISSKSVVGRFDILAFESEVRHDNIAFEGFKN